MLLPTSGTACAAAASCPQPHQEPTGSCRHVSRLVLEGPQFYTFFDMVEVANFEIASDAFTTFKVNGQHPQTAAVQKLMNSGDSGDCKSGHCKPPAGG